MFRYHNKVNFPDFYYEDRYVELSLPETFAGEEIAAFKGVDIWHMIYSGCILPAYVYNSEFVKEVIRFLKECLVIELETDKDPKKDFWPRGPLGLRKPDQIIVDGELSTLLYRCFISGYDIRHFSGIEKIKITKKDGLEEKDVFICTFTGGIVKEIFFS